MMLSPNASNSPRSALTPLWVISLFLSLTETVLGVGVIKTTGVVQVALTAFVIALPLIIALAFFVTLWHRNYVFYAPSEYGHLDVRQYVEAMQLQPRSDTELFPKIEAIVRSQVSSQVIVDQVLQALPRNAGSTMEQNVSKVLSKLADQTIESIKGTFLTIDSHPLVGDDGHVWQIPYSQYSTVSQFLDDLWFLLSEHGIPSMKYGILWALRDAATGRVLLEMGRSWAARKGGVLDGRSLRETGIVPGMRLEAVFLPSSANPPLQPTGIAGS